MGVKFDREKWKKFEDGIAALFDEFGDDLREIGEQAAAAIVQTTLAGIGENDAPFREYSKGYKALLEQVGGKPGGVVNLRGVFYHDSKDRKFSKTAKAKGAGRRATVILTLGGRTFVARSKFTRPQKGLIDKDSEMSLDLIEVKVEGEKVRLIYRPRKKNYMIHHQESRKWFTLKREAVHGSAVETMRTLLAARVDALRGEMGLK